MSIGVLCGLNEEAAIIDDRDTFDITIGAANVATLKQQIISKQIDRLISWGTCGALAPYLSVGSIVLANKVIVGGSAEYPVNIRWMSRLPQGGVHIGPMFSHNDTEVTTPKQRAELFTKYGAIAVDEESDAVAELAAAYKIPFIVVRCVSDGPYDRLPPIVNCLNDDGSINLWSAFTSLVSHPLQIGSIIRTGVDFNKAISVLKRYYIAAYYASATSSLCYQPYP